MGKIDWETINRLCGMRDDKLTNLTKRANEHKEKLNNLICNIMNDGFVIYCDGKKVEPSDLDIEIEWG